MMPEDMLSYCQQHSLLDTMLSPPGSDPAAQATAATSDYHDVYSDVHASRR